MHPEQSINPYQKYFENYLLEINELKLRSYHFQSVLNQSLKAYTKESLLDFEVISGVGMVLSDWTGQTDKGWKINHHSGITSKIKKSTYQTDSAKMLSYHCAYTFSQCYERLCVLIKDLIFQRAIVVPQILAYKNKNKELNFYIRENIPGGYTLHEILKKACGKDYSIASNNNNHKVRFPEYWKIISEVRHCITHSNSVIDENLIAKSKSHNAHFRYYFPNHFVSEGKVYLSFNYKDLQLATQGLVEYGLQIFKLISIQEGFKWDYFIKK